MSERELYKKKFHAQLDVLKADVEKLKSKAAEASAEIKIELDKKIKVLDHQMDGVHTKLSELSSASADAWEVVKKNVESAWDSVKKTYNEVVDKFKK